MNHAGNGNLHVAFWPGIKSFLLCYQTLQTINPGIISSVVGKIRIPNMITAPRVLKKNEPFCQIRPVTVASLTDNKLDSGGSVHPPNTPPTVAFYSESVRLDPDCVLDDTIRI